MARVINTNSPGKRRNAHMRTIAEILRLLSQRTVLDDPTKDMVATVVSCLRAIDATVEESIVAWEKRGYWKKADDFQQKWWWCSLSANALEALIIEDQWDQVPEAMAKLFPHVSGINVSKLTRDPKLWAGSYRRLVGDKNH